MLNRYNKVAAMNPSKYLIELQEQELWNILTTRCDSTSSHSFTDPPFLLLVSHLCEHGFLGSERKVFWIKLRTDGNDEQVSCLQIPWEANLRMEQEFWHPIQCSNDLGWHWMLENRQQHPLLGELQGQPGEIQRTGSEWSLKLQSEIIY